MSASRVLSTRSGSSSTITPVRYPSPATSPRSRPTFSGLRASAPTMSTPFSSIIRVATEFIAPTPYTIALIRLIALLPSRNLSASRRERRGQHNAVRYASGQLPKKPPANRIWATIGSHRREDSNMAENLGSGADGHGANGHASDD